MEHRLLLSRLPRLRPPLVDVRGLRHRQPLRSRHCNECDIAMPAELLGDRDEGFEMAHAEWIAPR
ncbi:hypothetical protein [Streptomyces sp. wa1064]|uniref:hypothetical protein n=1 Tax=Streptomyces sp. wa1064 TaxID=1828213 RepID=UPI003C7BC1BD